MWDKITPADIERAKAAWIAMRDKIVARQQQEMKILEMDGNLLSSLEVGLSAFHQRFMAPPQLKAVGSEPSSTTDASPADKPEAPPFDENGVIPFNSSSLLQESEPTAGDDNGPNFVARERKWIGGRASSSEKGDLSVRG
jgi:hypothetical protein